MRTILEQAIQPPSCFRNVLPQDGADEQFAKDGATGAKDVPLPVQLLNAIADDGDLADCLAEVIRVQQIAIHAESPISRRV